MKRIVSLFLVMVMMFTLMPTVSLADDANFTIIDNVGAKVKAGETKDFTLKIQNIGGDAARKTEIEFDVKNDDKKTIGFAEPVKYVGYIAKSGTSNVAIKIIAKDTAKIGQYPVEMVISYYTSTGSKSSVTKKFNIDITEEKIAPRLKLSLPANFSLLSGDAGQLKFNLTNGGEIDLRTIKLELTNQDKSGMYIEGDTNFLYVESLLKGETKPLAYNVMVSDTYTDPTIAANIKYSFKDVTGTEYTGEQNLFVILNDVRNKSLEMDNVSIDKSEVGKNEIFNLTGTVKNTGDTDIASIDIAMDLEDGIIPVTQSVYHENIIKVGESKVYTFKLKAKEDAAEKNYNIKMKATYKKGTKDEVAYRYAGVFLRGGLDGKKSVPKIIIGQYKINPGIVRADSEFTLDVSFKNTHTAKTVKNIKAFITVDEKSNETGSVFSPVNASNTFYITSIAPGQSVKKQLKMYTIPDAKPKTYELIINIEYEDEEGTALTGKEFIGVPVKQRTKIELSDVTSNSEKFVGQDVYMAANVLNTGMTDVRNVKVSVVGDVEKRSPEQFFGSFPAGTSQYVELVISPTQVGPVSGEVVMTYEDISGNVEEVRKPFSFEAIEYVADAMSDGGILGPDGKPMDPNGAVPVQGFNWILWGSIIGGVVLVIAAVAFIIIRKKRRKKKEIEMMLNE